MKITVVGTGAMGSLFAGYLAKIQEDVWAYDVWREHIEVIKRDGLLMTRNKVSRRVRLKATTDPTEPGVADLILVFVKHVHTRQAAKDALPMIGPHTAVLTLQNGIGNVEILQEIIPSRQILFGLTTLTSELLGPGHIEESYHGEGETHLWPLSARVTMRTKKICSTFCRAGIHTEISSDLQLKIWKKLIINACHNSLSAITGLKSGDLMDEFEARQIFEGVVSEIVQIAQKRDILIEEENALRFLEQVAGEAKGHVPSMLVDVRNRKETEIECLNGAVIREGEKLGISTPYNRVLYSIVRVIENTYDKRLR